jgi:hypothetical protein
MAVELFPAMLWALDIASQNTASSLWHTARPRPHHGYSETWHDNNAPESTSKSWTIYIG